MQNLRQTNLSSPYLPFYSFELAFPSKNKQNLSIFTSVPSFTAFFLWCLAQVARNTFIKSVFFVEKCLICNSNLIKVYLRISLEFEECSIRLLTIPLSWGILWTRLRRKYFNGKIVFDKQVCKIYAKQWCRARARTWNLFIGQ